MKTDYAAHTRTKKDITNSGVIELQISSRFDVEKLIQYAHSICGVRMFTSIKLIRIYSAVSRNVRLEFLDKSLEL